MSRLRLLPRQLIPLLALGLLLALGSLALAQSGVPEIAWWTVDGGGGTASGGLYTVSGTIGQPEAGNRSSGGIYAVSGGVWGGLGAASGQTSNTVFMPLIQRD